MTKPHPTQSEPSYTHTRPCDRTHMQQGFHFREEAEAPAEYRYVKASGADPKSGNGGSAQWQIVAGIPASCALAGLGWSQRIPALK
ncbi:uncharacterized protein N7518_003983 [Penicillium psychrosexuale]|uniref:uncharacterized protein n=1 Tax=Penicillium psychrosexuale TaxID=1002107 RepID=UPI002544D5F3|nr:uncharacterized protein N7518_003983 [Penicillium psychrosexuale]KAJ5795443.1 hypothetical protein N7518_003983 [Penicillium psychrosexuale]